MSGINKVILVGHLGKDPEVRHLDGGVTVASFPLATSETYNKDGKKIEQTEWHNIVMWRSLADIASKYLQKGKLVYIEGKLRTRSWQDQEGNTRYITEVLGDNMTMLGKAGEASSLPEPPSQTFAPPKKEETPLGDEFSNADADNDDLPF